MNWLRKLRNRLHIWWNGGECWLLHNWDFPNGACRTCKDCGRYEQVSHL